MNDRNRENAADNSSSELRDEVAELRERVARLEALLGADRTDTASQPAGSVADARAVTEAPAPASPDAGLQTPSAPSLEATIGSQWLSRLGILAVLVGVALFLKLAIDNHWIGPAARVVLGLAGGLAVFAVSEPFRRRGYPAFSSSLKGIGTGVLYLSLWASFSLFHLFPVWFAGLCMVVVTAGNGLLAWRQNSLVLAFYALVGGLITPFLLSTTREHEVALFAYLLLLAGAASLLVLLRGWNGLLLLAFGGGGLYAVYWAFAWYSPDEFSITVVFAAAGFLLFALEPFLRGSGPPRSGSHTALAVANALGGVILAIALYAGLEQALAVLGIAVFYYLLARLRPDRPESPLEPWVVPLNGNMALLVGVAVWIHWLWHSVAGVTGLRTGEQLSYSFWFMGMGAVLVAVGFWRRRAALRWQGLVLLLASITKVFVVDMAFLSAGLRVFSFLGLGLLLLAVSFVYQRDWLKLRGKS